MIGFEPAVRIPDAGTTTTVLDLNEADTALHESASGEQLRSKFLTMGQLEPIQGFCCFGFIRKIEYLGYRFLHSKCQFIGENTRGHRGVIRILNTTKCTQLLDQIEAYRLLSVPHGTLGSAKVERILRIDTQGHGIV